MPIYLMRRSWLLTGRLARYGIVGLCTNLSAYLLFIVFLYGGIEPAVASGLTYIVAVAVSYFAHRKWSFRSTASHLSDIPRYLFAYGTGLAVTVGSMYILAGWIAPEIAQILVIFMTAGVIFALLEVLKFGG